MFLYHMHTYELEDKLLAIHTLSKRRHKHWYSGSNGNLCRNSEYVTHKNNIVLVLILVNLTLSHKYLYRLKLTNDLIIFKVTSQISKHKSKENRILPLIKIY